MSDLDFPSIFILPAHLDPDELHKLEEQIASATHNPNEAEIIIGKVSQPGRAMFELRRHGVAAERLDPQDRAESTAGEPTSIFRSHGSDAIVKVVKLNWFTDSSSRGQVLPLDDYLVVEARKTAPPGPGDHILTLPNITGSLRKRPPLLQQSTSEDASLPPIPDYLDSPYACERPTPSNPPNAPFIEELKKIRKARILNGDNVGVRAYSSSIASIAAYPYLLQTGHEVARLPGCGHRIAELYQEWKDTDTLAGAEAVASDPRLSVLSLFYDIWGVGDTTAREFYSKGWRDLDDVVEYGWNNLTRVQQIGVKYYDEFLVPIPRLEVESIADIILAHARKVSKGFEMVIVGGYRRGKTDCGDVDVVLSHPEESMTQFFINRIVVMLEKEGYITHTLTLSTKNSERGQKAVPWKGNTSSGTGFDTLDKALVVWQSPEGSVKGESECPLHRRVDIIISPWRTAGCAVLGWSGGTTFERDLRRYCKKEKRLKFDSSGVRSRLDGSWVDLEGDSLGPAPDMVTAEKRVFSGLGLQWRPPEERCTG